MTPEYHKAEAGKEINVIGRWMDLASGSGTAIAEASNIDAMMAWSLNWTEMAELKFTPVVDDKKAGSILKAKYAPTGETVTNESLGNLQLAPKMFPSQYLINFKFYENKKIDAYKLFACMSLDDHKADAGKNINMLGRWMDLASGSGVAIAESSGIEAMMAWSLNWTEMAELKFTPVLDDDAATVILKAKYCQG
eukprot:CAMPEP_0119033954 /NCGR_PEP_ID=MMETSP1177-20130426/1021_1 /TAXON_ID=2985 /ORGANISM="Ochromonas sp, Strain CCMP1899" /LENGTH=193 /DNA_ID=CAMNT_0006991097 /DNA_START=206 /DNA_END=787 /DNA_ORIENTATION=-